MAFTSMHRLKAYVVSRLVSLDYKVNKANQGIIDKSPNKEGAFKLIDQHFPYQRLVSLITVLAKVLGVSHPPTFGKVDLELVSYAPHFYIQDGKLRVVLAELHYLVDGKAVSRVHGKAPSQVVERIPPRVVDAYTGRVFVDCMNGHYEFKYVSDDATKPPNDRGLDKVLPIPTVKYCIAKNKDSTPIDMTKHGLADVSYLLLQLLAIHSLGEGVWVDFMNIDSTYPKRRRFESLEARLGSLEAKLPTKQKVNEAVHNSIVENVSVIKTLLNLFLSITAGMFIGAFLSHHFMPHSTA